MLTDGKVEILMYVGHVPQIIGLLKTSMHDQETILAHGTFGRKQTYLCTSDGSSARKLGFEFWKCHEEIVEQSPNNKCARNLKKK